MKILKLLFTAGFLLSTVYGTAQGLKAFKLPNGLSVFVWEDHTKPNVVGMVSVKVGSKDDPANLTGSAHYLEHLLFKGTKKIGALDWEQETILYRNILQKYDEMAVEPDPAKKRIMAEEINRLSIEAGKISSSAEFTTLTEGVIGGNRLNAGTSYDYTIYHNHFPPEEIHRWLQLNSERLIDPVFRGFQAELETVYEEYNIAQDNEFEQIGEFMRETVYPGHPYSRGIAGLGEHLKNPQPAKLHEFFNKWYVPGNMALILSGNVRTEDVVSSIKSTFGRLEAQPVPQPVHYPEFEIKGRKETTAKLAPYPEVILAFPGVTENHPDKIILDICVSVLSNSGRSGLLDRLSIEGDLIDGQATLQVQKEQGRIMIEVIPYYDINQRRFNSLKATEKMILAEIKKLQEGNFEEELVQSIKGEMIRQYELALESNFTLSLILSNLFINDMDPAGFLNYKEIVAGITSEQIKATAKKYFGKDYIALMIQQGKPGKKEKLEKPRLQALQPPHNPKSEFARQFEQIPVKRLPVQFIDMDEVQTKPINNRSKLYYSKNPENNIFSLTLRYGIGAARMPMLNPAVTLMNNAGIMGQMEAGELKKQFGQLGTVCRYEVNDNYLTIYLEGFEENLENSCNLMTRQILLPKLDEKQWDNIKGQLYHTRTSEKERIRDVNEAGLNYLLYREQSKYIDRLPLTEIMDLTISGLTGEFQRATDYEAEVYYVGSSPFDKVYEILSKNLPLKQGEKESSSPEIKELATIDENVVYFTPFSNAKQSNIYFYSKDENYTKTNDIPALAFEYYFGLGFTSIIFQEIREQRSMAYDTRANIMDPPKPGHPSFFLGYVGTQADNTIKAVDLFMKLLEDMPEYPERMDNLKNYLRQVTLAEKPDFRHAGQVYQSWKMRGYKKSPAEENMEKIENLTFDDIKTYYRNHIKGKKIAISIVGDPKQIDLKALEKYGKLMRLTPAKLFSDK